MRLWLLDARQQRASLFGGHIGNGGVGISRSVGWNPLSVGIFGPMFKEGRIAGVVLDEI
jgi:hypothetical protein